MRPSQCGNMYTNSYVSDEVKLSQAINAFKLKFPDVDFVIGKIEVPMDMDQMNAYYKKLATAGMSGDGPDIVLADSVFMVNNDIYKMQEAGAFADLTEFVENDDEFNFDEYISLFLMELNLMRSNV